MNTQSINCVNHTEVVVGRAITANHTEVVVGRAITVNHTEVVLPVAAA